MPKPLLKTALFRGQDADGVRGPMEEALIGTRVKNPENPLEIHHVVRSFDPCLVCTVHAIDLR